LTNDKTISITETERAHAAGIAMSEWLSLLQEIDPTTPKNLTADLIADHYATQPHAEVNA